MMESETASLKSLCLFPNVSSRYSSKARLLRLLEELKGGRDCMGWNVKLAAEKVLEIEVLVKEEG